MNYEYWKKNIEHCNILYNEKKIIKCQPCNSVICVFISFNWKKKPLDKENIKWVIKQTVMRRGEGVSVCGITHD